MAIYDVDMNPLEIAAAMFGLVNVALVVRRSVWNYPFGLVMVSLYALLFFEQRLYSDMLLQYFFFAIQLYGWVNWARAGRFAGGVSVAAMGWTTRIGWLVFAALFSVALGAAMHRWTDAAAPFVDSAIAGFSVAAQILQSRRRVESWVLWIAVDVVAIGLFWQRGLTVTAALYAIFLMLSVLGLLEWARMLRAERRATA